MIASELYKKVGRALKEAEKILIISHRKPDGDTLGSNCALHLTLRSAGKEVVSACIDDIADCYEFIPVVDRFVKDFDYTQFDLIVVVDCGAHYMSKYHELYPDIFSGKPPVINIDHHPSNDSFGTINLVDIEAASTSLIIFRLFEKMHITITPQIATALLTGLYYDTGSFMHSNTTSETLRVSSALLKRGADYKTIIKNIFKTTSINTLHLWGRVLSNIKVNSDGVTLSVATKKDFKDCNANPEALSGVIDLINSVPGSNFSVLLNEDKGGQVKGSFRTQKDTVDLSEIASQFGGGGHKKAAGFTLPGRLKKEVTWKIVPEDQEPGEGE